MLKCKVGWQLPLLGGLVLTLLGCDGSASLTDETDPLPRVFDNKDVKFTPRGAMMQMPMEVFMANPPGGEPIAPGVPSNAREPGAKPETDQPTPEGGAPDRSRLGSGRVASAVLGRPDVGGGATNRRGAG